MPILANIDCKFEGQFSVPPEILIEKIKDSTNAVLIRCKNEDDRTFHHFYLQALQHFIGEKRVKKEASNLKIFKPEEFVTQFITLLEVIPCITNHANGYRLIFSDFNITIEKVEDDLSRDMFPSHHRIDDQCVLISATDQEHLATLSKLIANDIHVDKHITTDKNSTFISSQQTLICTIPSALLRQFLTALFQNNVASLNSCTNN